jgi:hypothetical protein
MKTSFSALDNSHTLGETAGRRKSHDCQARSVELAEMGGSGSGIADLEVGSVQWPVSRRMPTLALQAS